VTGEHVVEVIGDVHSRRREDDDVVTDRREVGNGVGREHDRRVVVDD
jgi:hypothetical protein